jgi:hypothetical protein
MPEAPEDLTDREQMTWRNLERCLQAHCGTDVEWFRIREESFIKVASIMMERISSNHAANDAAAAIAAKRRRP